MNRGERTDRGDATGSRSLSFSLFLIVFLIAAIHITALCLHFFENSDIAQLFYTRSLYKQKKKQTLSAASLAENISFTHFFVVIIHLLSQFAFKYPFYPMIPLTYFIYIDFLHS